MIFIYAFFLILAILVWVKQKTLQKKDSNLLITAIVVVKNEEKNIENLLSSFKNQSYRNFEIIIVNDNSDDKTIQIIENFNLDNLQLIHLNASERGIAPKKSGIEKAIKLAKGAYIFSTDGDCILPPKILEEYAQTLSKSDEINMICGPVTFTEKNTFWNHIQTIEFASLIGSAAVAVHLNRPIMSSAANFIYKKSIFQEIGGYQESMQTASGDDEFLMNKIQEKYPRTIVFAQNRNCIVQTLSSQNLKSFYHQRKRWAGKWSQSINWVSQTVAVFIFLVNLLTIYYLFTFNIEALLLRFLPEFTFLALVLVFLKKSKSIIYIPFTQLIYPFYVVFFGLISIIPSSYIWKETKLK